MTWFWIDQRKEEENGKSKVMRSLANRFASVHSFANCSFITDGVPARWKKQLFAKGASPCLKVFIIKN